MSKSKIYKLIIIILLLLVCLFLISKELKKQQVKNTINLIHPPSIEKQIYELSTEKTETIKNKKNLSFKNETTYEITVFDLIQKLQNEKKIDFKYKNYTAMGAFIEEINGIKNTGEENWIYYVNNKKATIGISNYKLNKGDIVSFKYEKGL